MKPYFFIISILCAWAINVHASRPTTVRVYGANQQILTVMNVLDLHGKPIFKLRDSTAQYQDIQIPKCDTSAVYCLGSNNRLCFFALHPEEIITIDVSGDKPIVKGEAVEKNNYLGLWNAQLFGEFPTLFPNRLLFKLAQPEYIKIPMEVLTNENYVEGLQNFFAEARKNLKNADFDDNSFKQQFYSFLDYSYWDAIVATYRHIREAEVPNSLWKQLNNLPITDLQKLQATNPYWLTMYLKAQEDQGKYEYNLENYIAQKAKCISNRDVREWYILQELERLLQRKEIFYLKELTASCRPLIKNKESIQRFEKLSASVNNFIENDSLNGVPAQEFQCSDRNGNLVTLSDFKGKYVYIDIWATWCGPCKQEIPHLQKLEHHYKDNDNIEFISLSVDKIANRQVWLDYLDQHGMHGMHCIAPNDFKTPFVRRYGVNAIPRFMLIAPNGEMIAHNCWRPSDPRIVMLLDKMLSKH